MLKYAERHKHTHTESIEHWQKERPPSCSDPALVGQTQQIHVEQHVEQHVDPHVEQHVDQHVEQHVEHVHHQTTVLHVLICPSDPAARAEGGGWCVFRGLTGYTCECVYVKNTHFLFLHMQPPMTFHLLHHNSRGIDAAQGQSGFSDFSSALHFFCQQKSKTHIRTYKNVFVKEGLSI